MNFRTLKNGTRIEEPKFQAMLEKARKSKPETTEEDLLAALNKAGVKTLAPEPKPIKKPRGRIG